MAETSMQVARSAPTRAVADLLEGLSEASYNGARDSLKTIRLANYVAYQLLEGNIFPAMGAAVDMHEAFARSMTGTLRGEQTVRGLAAETLNRVRSAAKFGRMVKRYGKALFGSATYEGETTLAAEGAYRLVYIPPASGGGEAPFVLFHAGGAIPYGDRIFRFLPEASFYERFRERGIPVYAMEVRGDRSTAHNGKLTMERLIDIVDRFSETAYRHAGERKMILEGYCGHGMQTLAFVAAKPREADRRFRRVTTFVSPYDGTECTMLAELQGLTPAALRELSMLSTKLNGGYVPGDAMRTSLDLSLRTMFHKTPMGHVAAGWTQGDYATVKGLEDLNKKQRRDLAGAYWISPACAKRFPLPADVARFASGLFTEGIGPDGAIPWTYRGRGLSFRTILQETELDLVGFFGGRDPMIPDRTAYGVMALMGDRYRHVVHPNAGHISYILSPKSWKPTHPQALVPNPIDVLSA